IANQREDLDLFADGDAFVIFLLNIEVADCEIAERADGREPAATELLLARELLEVLHDFIAAVEDQSPGAFGATVEKFRFHSEFSDLRCDHCGGACAMPRRHQYSPEPRDRPPRRANDDVDEAQVLIHLRRKWWPAAVPFCLSWMFVVQA